jgi:HD-like signal output (HDOD) protein
MNRNSAVGSTSEPVEGIRETLAAALRNTGVELLPMPETATRIMALAFDAASTAQQLSELIQRDPTLAGNLMRIANSALYAPRTAIGSLQQAVTWLGMSEVQNLAVALAVRGQVFRAPGHEAYIDELWRESLATAMWARIIANTIIQVRKSQADVAYLCGLLHLIGRAGALSLLSRAEAERRLVCHTRSVNGLLDEFEAECAKQVVNDWCLPKPVVSGVLHWRGYETLDDFRDVAATVNAARQLATASLHPDLMQVEELVADPAFAALRLDEDKLLNLLERREEIRRFVNGA